MATWSTVSTPDTGSGYVNDILGLGSGKWVAVGTAGTVLTSADNGQTWTIRTAAEANDWQGLATDGSRIVSVSNNGANRVMYSDDEGATWTSASAAAAEQWVSICWAPSASKYIAVNANGSGGAPIMSSADGITWATETATAKNLLGVVASSTVIVATTAGSPAAIMTSSDGSAWTDYAGPTDFYNPVGGGSFTIAYNVALDRFGMGGRSPAATVTASAFAYSDDDGQTWTVVSTGTSNLLGVLGVRATPALGGFIADIPYDNVGNPTNTLLLQSTDGGASWTTIDTGESGLWYGAMGWDDAAGTFVMWDDNITNTMLIGVFNVASLSAVSPAIGTEHTTLRITGTGLAGVGQGDVLIDGIAALSVSAKADGTAVTCLAPAHSIGPVDVTVMGIGTLANAFTYVVLDRLVPTSGTVAGGNTVTLRGYGFDFATGVTFDGIVLSNWTIVSNTEIRAVAPPHNSGAVTVAVLGVGSGATYTYVIPQENLPPPPYRVPIYEGGGPLIAKPWLQWFNTITQRVVGSASDIVPAESVVGVLSVDTIPALPWTKVSKDGSSLADLEVRNASDLNAGRLKAIYGGTGFSEYAIGDLLYADTTRSLATLADVSAGSYLRSGGVDTAPEWSTLTLPNAASAGDLLVASGANVMAAQAPAALTRTNDTNVTLTLDGSPATALVHAASLTLGWAGTLALSRGGLGGDFSSLAKGGLIVGTAAATAGITAVGADGTVLIADAASTGGVKWDALSALTIPYTSVVSVPTATVLGRTTAGTGAAEALSTLPSAVQDTITRTGALDSGSITSGFGSINVGSDSITGGAVSGTTGVFATSVSTPSLITASGALTITPAAGSNLNLALSTTGDFAVNTNQLYVDTSAARVGIGTTNPVDTLQVSGGGIQLDDNQNIQWGDTGTAIDGSASSDFLRFFTSGQEKVRIDSFGNVGIGTTAPLGSGVKLHLHNTDTSQTQEYFTNSDTGATGNDGFRIGLGSNQTAIVWNNENTALRFATSNGEKMRIDENGNVGIGTPSPGTKLDVNGSIGSRHATGGIGYTTGAGGTVTQATSKATAFTLSKVSGRITTANDALAAGASVSATWTNTAIAATDVVIITHVSGGTIGAYAFNVACGAGSATLTITNRSAGSLSEALVLGFVVLKGVTS